MAGTYDQAIFPVASGLLPTGSPRALRRLIPLSTTTPYSFDLYQEGAKGDINNIQAIFIDNSQNGSPVTVTVSGTQLRLILPPQWQGILPLFSTTDPKIVVTSAGAVDIPIHLLNVPLPFMAWPCAAQTVSVSQVSGAFTDRSGSIAAGGTSQLLAAANANRKRLIVQNPSDSPESIFINFTAAATVTGNSLEILAGEMYDTAGGPITTEAVNVIAATTGTKFTAKEM